jgi:PAS domain S-box-containing protein
MENKTQKIMNGNNDLKRNSVMLIALLLMLVSLMSSFFSAGRNEMMIKLSLFIAGVAVLLLVTFKVLIKLVDFYVHILLLSLSAVVSYLLINTSSLNDFYFYSASLIVFLLITSLVYNWHFVNQILSVVYATVIVSVASKLNPAYYKFILGHFSEILFYLLLLGSSVVISIANFIITARTKKDLVEIKTESAKENGSLEIYKEICENLSDGLFRSTIDGKLIFANPSFAKILGYNEAEEIYKLNIANDLYVDSEEREKLIKILAAQKKIKNYRIKLKKKDSSQIIARVNERLITDENEQPLFIEGSLQDITQQAIIEEEKNQQLEELRNEKIKAVKDVNAAVYTSNIKAQFLASMSHEIKTPINSIIGFLTLIEKKMFDSEEELQEFAQNAKTAADSLLDIINNVLDISKIEAGKMELDDTEFNFRDEIQKATAIITPQVSAKNLILSVEIDPNIPAVIFGDPVRFRQVVLNILSNSVKYTDRGEIILRVSVIKITQATIKIKTSIIDTGRGIPKEKLPLIFKPYTQVKQKKWTERDGSGLGLMISKQLVELMGGEISIYSEEGIGTTVEFTAVLKLQKQFEIQTAGKPDEIKTESDNKKILYSSENSSNIGTVDLEVKKDISDEIPQQKNDQFINQTKSKSGKRILLVEDNPISQKVEKKLLSDIGYDVEPVSSAYDAIEAIKTNIFDLVLMDIEMPDMDGLTATQKIRALDPPVNKIPIIAVTAHSSMKDREKCLAAGMDDYIAKPININFMKIIIDQWLNR